MKTLLKKLIPEIYWQSLSWWRLHFGALDALRTHLPLLIRRDRLLQVSVKVDGRSAPVWLRPGTADLDVYREIFKDNEYDLDIEPPRRIVDAGGHIGLASVYFALRFPEAQIVVLEPEAGNYSLLQKNVGSLGNVIAVNAGLWSKKSRLVIENEGATTWAFTVRETNSASGLEAWGVTDVLQLFKNGGRLLLKIDIEGSEVEVLSTSSAWMDQADTIVIELHDRFRPGCKDALTAALAEYSFDEHMSGESHIINNLKPRETLIGSPSRVHEVRA